MRATTLVAVVLAAILLVTVPAAQTGPAVEITFTSTQFSPVHETEWARDTLFRAFETETGIRVRFVSELAGPYMDRLQAEARAGRGSIDLTGTLHGDFPILVPAGVARDMASVQADLARRGDRTFFPDLVRISQIGGTQAYVPWMQATYLIVAHKRAMAYFPRGSNPMAMTYDDLLEWGDAIKVATGTRRIGFPAGPGGLFGRFLHGYIYPSFTGSQVKRFKSPEAVEMWRYLRRLGGVLHPGSFLYSFMHEPLLLGEVWVAWDHTARLLPALRDRPDDFVVLPSPAGPRGRSFLSVIVGLTIPKTAPNADAAARLIEFLTRPRTQVLTVQGVAFFPTVREAAGAVPTGGMKLLAEGVTAQQGARDARVALLPVGLGVRTGEFVPLYVDTFREISVLGKPIEEVLAAQARKLEELYRAMNAMCPPPDPAITPCKPD